VAGCSACYVTLRVPLNVAQRGGKSLFQDHRLCSNYLNRKSLQGFREPCAPCRANQVSVTGMRVRAYSRCVLPSDKARRAQRSISYLRAPKG
jgi:hypothetical protein